MEIGERIYYRRLELGMSQEELAKKVGYKTSSCRSSIQKIEKGINNIPANKIEAFATALNMTEDDLMGWSRESMVSDQQYEVNRLQKELEVEKDPKIREELEAQLFTAKDLLEEYSLIKMLEDMAKANKEKEERRQKNEADFMAYVAGLPDADKIRIAKKIMEMI